MSDLSGLERFSFRARQAIEKYLIAFEPENLADGEALAEANILVRDLDEELPGILDEVMKRGGWRSQCMAAVMFLKAAEHFPQMADNHKEIVCRAESTLADLVENPQDEDGLQWTCVLMGRIGVAPDCALDRLEALCDECAGSWTPVYAATALCWASRGESIARAQKYLSRLLSTEDKEVTVVIAPTLITRRDFITADLLKRAVSQLVEVAATLDWTQQMQFVRILGDAGPVAISAIPMLRDIFVNPEIPSSFRAWAGSAIGRVARGSKEDMSELSDALRSNDWHLVSGAAQGLAAYGDISTQDVLQLASHLEADDLDLRRAAAAELKNLGPPSWPALPTLIARFGKEPDPQLALGLTEAVAAIGIEAVDPLIEEIRRLDFRTMTLAAGALKDLADVSVAAVVEKLLGDPLEQIRIVGFLVLQAMGSKAAPAVPTFGSMLDDANDIELAHNLIAAIGMCGRAGEPAADSVVRAMIRFDNDDIEDIAIRALQQFGAGAIRELRGVQPATSGTTRRRIENAIAACKRRVDDRYLHLEKLNDDDLLRYFVLVGQVIEDKKLSWGKIGKKIAPYVAQFKSQQNVFGTSPNAVRDNVRKLAKALSEKELTSHKPNRTGKLTPTGKKILNQATEYLRTVYGQAPEVND